MEDLFEKEGTYKTEDKELLATGKGNICSNLHITNTDEIIVAKLYGKGNQGKKGPRNSTHIRLHQRTHCKNKSPVFSTKGRGTVASSFLYHTDMCPTTESFPLRTSRIEADELPPM